MAMNSHSQQSHFCTTTTTTTVIARILLFFNLFLLLISPVASIFHQSLSPDTTRGLLLEGKTRLGSTPPSCHNKCNQCHPCLAVQVPTMPTHDHRFQPGHTRPMPMEVVNLDPSVNRYSNYKPLGWKCRCNGHFFNP